jgi:hypothetical protein
MIARRIGGIDRDTPESNCSQHCEEQERGSQGRHLGLRFLCFWHELGYESVSVLALLYLLEGKLIAGQRAS